MNPSKIRNKQIYQATNQFRGKQAGSHLSKQLRQKYGQRSVRILNGDTVSGVTTMIMDKGMDTGDILLTKETSIELNDDANSLHDKLAEQGAELVLETLSRLEKNNLLLNMAV